VLEKGAVGGASGAVSGVGDSEASCEDGTVGMSCEGDTTGVCTVALLTLDAGSEEVRGRRAYTGLGGEGGGGVGGRGMTGFITGTVRTERGVVGETGGDIGAPRCLPSGPVSMLSPDLGFARAPPNGVGPEITLPLAGESRPPLPGAILATVILSSSPLFPNPEPFDPRWCRVGGRTGGFRGSVSAVKSAAPRAKRA
jgi:hypothetical protein